MRIYDVYELRSGALRTEYKLPLWNYLCVSVLFVLILLERIFKYFRFFIMIFIVNILYIFNFSWKKLSSRWKPEKAEHFHLVGPRKYYIILTNSI